MLLNRQSTVIRSTLQELLLRNKKEAESQRIVTVLILLFDHMNGIEEGCKGLDGLCKNARVRLCPDPSILEQYDVTGLAKKTGIDDWITLSRAEKIKESIDHFYIPVLPFGTVSDLLHFNDSRQSIRLLLWALMRGKQVSALSAGADPYHHIWPHAGLAQGPVLLKHEMIRQLQQIRGYGVQLFSNIEEVKKYFRHGQRDERKPVITAKTIKQQAAAGLRHIEVGQGTIITPLARDMAGEYQMELIGDKEGEAYGNGNRGWPSHSNKKR